VAKPWLLARSLVAVVEPQLMLVDLNDCSNYDYDDRRWREDERAEHVENKCTVTVEVLANVVAAILKAVNLWVEVAGVHSPIRDQSQFVQQVFPTQEKIIFELNVKFEFLENLFTFDDSAARFSLSLSAFCFLFFFFNIFFCFLAIIAVIGEIVPFSLSEPEDPSPGATPSAKQTRFFVFVVL
jgi:hypothetical protein